MNQATRETTGLFFVIAVICLMVGFAVGTIMPHTEPQRMGLFFRQIGPENTSQYVRFSLQTTFYIGEYQVIIHDRGGGTFAGGGWSSGRYQNIAEGTTMRFVLYISVAWNETYFYELYEENRTAAEKYYGNRVIGIEQSFTIHAGGNYNLTGDSAFGTYGYTVECREMGTEWWNNWGS